jgi:hypothetical protein
MGPQPQVLCKSYSCPVLPSLARVLWQPGAGRPDLDKGLRQQQCSITAPPLPFIPTPPCPARLPELGGLTLTKGLRGSCMVRRLPSA